MNQPLPKVQKLVVKAAVDPDLLVRLRAARWGADRWLRPPRASERWLLGASVLLGCLAAVSLQPRGVVAQGLPVMADGPHYYWLVGIPSPRDVIDVRWSGDRRGEFIELGVLPPAFRGPAPTR